MLAHAAIYHTDFRTSRGRCAGRERAGGRDRAGAAALQVDVVGRKFRVGRDLPKSRHRLLQRLPRRRAESHRTNFQPLNQFVRRHGEPGGTGFRENRRRRIDDNDLPPDGGPERRHFQRVAIGANKFKEAGSTGFGEALDVARYVADHLLNLAECTGAEASKVVQYATDRRTAEQLGVRYAARGESRNKRHCPNCSADPHGAPLPHFFFHGDETDLGIRFLPETMETAV
ncbi:hypothetical protein SH591_15050 [Sphingomonas sp. LY54]|uniref:hypothetical protein n=1 Tax=Sphingomonas sp. LY54 TaxID=3095343 RepID=UPI002D76C02D|nr:hypothetical protein [Sphingomonas sp. LY54]WRP28398.1 hypothetical protein SH591_15050 [Sphingomonas sp. LY54]